MDPTEDLSARVLLKHILSTETPRTPITRSACKTQSSSATRSSNRLSRKDAGAQTPQDILRRSLRHKIRESITRQSLPSTKRRTASVVLKKLPSSTSMLFDDGDTPRHILKNILLTEPVKSPVVHEKAASEESQPSSAASSITRKRPSSELSGLDLPDLTIGNIESTAKALSRKRPRRSLNVTAFEKRLKDGEDVEENEESIGDHSSLSLSSSTSLSLKTPFVDVRTEKKGLQRRVSNRRKISEEEFGAAVNKRQMEGVSSFVQLERGLSETALSEGFTLGQSKLGELDITADILHCDTALYARPDAMTSSFSFVATQDKPTVMASQLQRQMEQEEQMEAEQSKLGKEKSTYAFPTEEGAEPQNEKCFSQSEEDVDAAEFQKEKEKSTADGHLEDAAMSEEEECIAESQTSVSNDTAEPEEEENRVEGAADSHTEEDAATRSQSEEEEPATDSQTEEEGAGDSHTEEGQCGVDYQPEEDVTARSQSEEEDITPDSQTEEEEGGAGDSQIEKEVAGDLQCEEDVAARSQTDEEEGAPDCQTEEEGAVELQSEEDVAARSHSEEEGDVAEYQSDQEDPAANSQSEEEGDLADSQPEDEHDEKPWEEDGEQASEQPEQDLEHISQRARRSEGRLIMPVKEPSEDLADATEAGWSDGKPKAHSSLEMESCESFGIPELAESSTKGPKDACYTEAEPDADKENSFNLLERTHDTEKSRHRSDHSPEEAAQQEEEWEDEEEDEEESDEISSKTPAFVRQKRNFFQPDPQASPSVFKNIQASSSTGEAFSAPKPKQVRQRRKGPAKKEARLPKSYLMSVFKHFAKTNVSADVYPVLQDIMDKYFDRLAVDLETYAVHAKRKTIEVEDAELLLKRQGHVNDKVPVEVLIEKYLRMDQRKLLIPIATSGNVVIPKTRR
ncbi:probable serine/threonine-protein kinase kinX isoform X3 [Sander lucioperca]|uniref:probable serine/threonine-protein kinase kinX isoform X3 n=1 Tax=Sander lucioperca TaxID=283035 RepID=UPI001653B1C6|nr:probable serine/threonine-protein kinase kinX isoform X3 [Sander lucioperca]